ncbi:MAG: Crp/Fnr family transcriptional regulator [Burkholderiales bacterium]|nr:Crp/Fnr family transcriptional regulator [Burkholderiales bacterium]
MMARPRIPVDDFLANLPLFRHLDGADIARVAAGVREIAAPRGTALFRRGDPCEGFHVVVFGRIKLALNSPDGAEKVIELMGPGQSFGEAVMFLEVPYMVTATALIDSKLLLVAREAVFDEIDRDARFARRMLAGLSMRLHRFISDLEAVSLRSGTERVIGYLLAQVQEADDADRGQITLPAKKGVIASRLNLTHEHFSRILHELARRDLIDVNGLQIQIRDAAKLRQYGSR